MSPFSVSDSVICLEGFWKRYVFLLTKMQKTNILIWRLTAGGR